MEKRILLAFLLTFLFLIIYTKFTEKYLSSYKDNTTIINQSNVTVGQILDQVNIFEPKQELKSTQIGNFIVSYSNTGGYIHKVKLKKYNNEELLYKNFILIPEELADEFDVELTENSIIFKSLDGRRKEFVFDEYNVVAKLNYVPKGETIIFSNSLTDKDLDRNYQEFFYKTHNENFLIRKLIKDIKKEMHLNNLNFLGFRDKYFCSTLIPANYTNIKLKNSKNVFYLSIDTLNSQISIFLGPQSERFLKKFGLGEIINYGMFDPIGKLLEKIMYLLYSFTKNWGISVIILAFLIYFLLYPLTLKSTKSMKKFSELQPRLNELQEKYRDYPAKLQKAQLELFKEYKINPLSGCLPMILQLPIFFALFQVFSRFVELKCASFLWIKDLSMPDKLFKFPFSLPYFGEYFNLLPILLLVIGILQQKFTTVSNVSTPEQKFFSNFFLVLISIVFYHFPSAIALYWLIQNFLTFIFQTRLITPKYSSVKIS